MKRLLPKSAASKALLPRGFFSRLCHCPNRRCARLPALGGDKKNARLPALGGDKKNGRPVSLPDIVPASLRSAGTKKNGRPVSLPDIVPASLRSAGTKKTADP